MLSLTIVHGCMKFVYVFDIFLVCYVLRMYCTLIFVQCLDN